MADTNSHELYDSHPESSGYANDDFEKLDPPGSGFDNDGGMMGDEDADDLSGVGSSGAYDYDYDRNQDAEISTTTDYPGEEDAEEDRYAVGASEAEANTNAQNSSEPLINFGDDYSNNVEDEEDIDMVYQAQPSAPVPDSNEPLIDFSHTEDPVVHPSSYSQISEPIPTSTANKVKESSPVVKTTEQSSAGTSSSKEKDKMTKILPPPEVHEKQTPSKDLLEQTVIYKYLVVVGTWLKGVDPRVKDLIYWRDVKKTGIVFGTLMMVLISLAIFTVISVIAYLSLAILTVTFSFVVYKKIMGAVQKSQEGHPFQPLLDLDIQLNENKLKSIIHSTLKNVNCLTHELRRLFLIEDLVDSIKFGLLLWALTYIGYWFSGMFLIIMDVVLLFTLPKVYETYQVQIDNYIGMAKAQVNNVVNIIQSRLPFLKKKEKAQ
ncbi:reticulon-1-B-like isoform X2 [Physella acuta]|uniref:reticulon-1-B-like isoform X2 n=1 Tax=Physella acuta TaxID=109671 RepID=UPI0027DB6211|nr:reticulon-1-B-like isoform X2 [Physella acuta]